MWTTIEIHKQNLFPNPLNKNHVSLFCAKTHTHCYCTGFIADNSLPWKEISWGAINSNHLKKWDSMETQFNAWPESLSTPYLLPVASLPFAPNPACLFSMCFNKRCMRVKEMWKYRPRKGIWIPCPLHTAPDYSICKPQYQHLGNRVNSIEISLQMSYSPIFCTQVRRSLMITNS